MAEVTRDTSGTPSDEFECLVSPQPAAAPSGEDDCGDRPDVNGGVRQIATALQQHWPRLPCGTPTGIAWSRVEGGVSSGCAVQKCRLDGERSRTRSHWCGCQRQPAHPSKCCWDRRTG